LAQSSQVEILDEFLLSKSYSPQGLLQQGAPNLVLSFFENRLFFM